MSTERDDAWRYDADKDDPLTALRIPVVRSPYPGWRYEMCVVITSDDLWGPALRPDDTETGLLVAYLEYRMGYYNPGWRAKMRRRPLDTDDSTNTTVLQKRGPADWCYRRDSWRSGPPVVPSRYDGEPPVGLAALLDRVNGYFTDATPRVLVINQRWAEYKAAHPDVFGEVIQERARNDTRETQQ